jgi:integrase
VPVYRHKGKWMYDFWKNEVRYRKGRYLSKQDAIEAEARARSTAKLINMDFVKLCENRLDDVETRRSKQYFNEMKSFFKSVAPIFANKSRIGKDDVVGYLNEIATTKSFALANKHFRWLKALFNHDDRILNPCKGISPYPLRPKKRYVPPMEDVKKVLSIANKEQENYLLTIIHTAGRVREINRLKPEDIGPKFEYVILRTRKAKNSDEVEREIQANKILKRVLKQLPLKGEYIFTNKRTKTKYDYRDKFLITLCDKAKVKPFTFHCLRHLSASLMADARVPLPEIQKILGHQRATTTDIYLRSIRANHQRGTNALEVIG